MDLFPVSLLQRSRRKLSLFLDLSERQKLTSQFVLCCCSLLQRPPKLPDGSTPGAGVRLPHGQVLRGEVGCRGWVVWLGSVAGGSPGDSRGTRCSSLAAGARGPAVAPLRASVSLPVSKELGSGPSQGKTSLVRGG